MDEIDKKLLNTIQSGFPISPMPYRSIGEKIGISEQEVIKRVKVLKSRGIIRRIGAIFNPQMIGYESTLIAMSVPQGMFSDVVEIVNTYPEITHNYSRRGKFNLWFTIIAR